MKKIFLTTFGAIIAIASFSQLKAEDVSISFHSEKEDITANNTTVSSTLDTQTGDLSFKVAIDAFAFANKTMQKHFNQEGVMNSAQFPIATFKGQIKNNAEVDYTADGTYSVSVMGTMTIKGASKDFRAKGKIVIKGGKISASSTFELDRFEFGVTGKEKSISQILTITVEADYK